jgi:hypothetical protein
LLARNFYDDETYAQAERELARNQASLSNTIESTHAVAAVVQEHPGGALVAVHGAAVGFTVDVATGDPRALAGLGEFTGQLFVPAGTAKGLKVVGESAGAARSAMRMDGSFQHPDIAGELDLAYLPATSGGRDIPALSMETGPYRVMRRRTDIEGQAHHLNQEAMYGGSIPHADAVSVRLRGDAFNEPGTPHYQVHQVQEAYLDQFRTGGSRFREAPTNVEMNRAMLDALRSAGYTSVQAKTLVREAIRDRVNYGLFGGEEVPRIPRRMYQVPAQ